jgi:hypothetical protein
VAPVVAAVTVAVVWPQVEQTVADFKAPVMDVVFLVVWPGPGFPATELIPAPAPVTVFVGCPVTLATNDSVEMKAD